MRVLTRLYSRELFINLAIVPCLNSEKCIYLMSLTFLRRDIQCSNEKQGEHKEKYITLSFI